jgi:hypothetical protein
MLLKLLKFFLTLLLIFFIFCIFLSTSPKNSVRLRLVVAGHPVSAIKCHPRYDRWMSSKAKSPVYDISKKYQFEPLNGGGNPSNMFKINNYLIFHWASPTWDFYV